MFTGIVEGILEIYSIEKDNNFYTINIKLNSDISDIKNGDSISINGVCLTVCNINNKYFSVNVVKETIKKTNLNVLDAKSHVNYERAMKLSSRIDGHIVQGHIEGLGKIISKNKLDNQVDLEIELQDDLLKYCIVKGSIALDGISLTIAELTNNVIKIAIIPYTYEHTILKYRNIGDFINIETDMFAKYIEKLNN
tara:strand:+ start:328 stop:912 length:585 start_codon:yes stop_codon:yes gene_type:complete